MSAPAPHRFERAAFAALGRALHLADNALGERWPALRSPVRHLAALIDAQRYGEVRALLRHGLRKTSRRLGIGGVPESSGPRLPHFGGIAIDAATQRLDADGKVVAKAHGAVFPSPEAPVLATIVIPCFNYGRFVREAVGSARAQTLACEIIVVDDGSTEPETIAVLDTLAHEWPDVRVIRQANQGLPCARNTGIAAARGEFICCLDADDLLDPSYLEAAIARLMSERCCGFVFPHARFFGDVEQTWPTRDFDPDDAMVANFTAVCAVFRRDDWREIGGYSPTMRGGFEDWEFWIRLSGLGRRGRALPLPLFLHRRHGRTMTHDAKDREQELHARIRALNPRHFADARARGRLRRLVPPRAKRLMSFAPLANAVRVDARPGLLVLLPWVQRGGAEVVTLAALRALAREWRIVLATTEIDPHAMRDAFRDAGIAVFHLPETLRREDRVAFLCHLATSRGTTHVLTSQTAFGIEALAALRAARPGLRAVNVLHNHAPDSVFRAAVRAGEAISCHVVVSEPAGTSLAAAGVSPEHVRLIPNGISPPPEALLADRMAIRAAFGLAREARVLIWAGRFGPEKRPEAFVDIMAALADLPDIHGVMLGDGPLAATVDAAITAAGLEMRIVRPGHCSPDEVARWMVAADVLVMTSTIEGMPLVALEAAAIGLPVAGTGVGDLPNAFAEGTISGWLVDPARPVEIARHLRTNWGLIEDDAARAKRRAAFLASARTEAAMAEAYRSLFAAL